MGTGQAAAPRLSVPWVPGLGYVASSKEPAVFNPYGCISFCFFSGPNPRTSAVLCLTYAAVCGPTRQKPSCRLWLCGFHQFLLWKRRSSFSWIIANLGVVGSTGGGRRQQVWGRSETVLCVWVGVYLLHLLEHLDTYQAWGIEGIPRAGGEEASQAHFVCNLSLFWGQALHFFFIGFYTFVFLCFVLVLK